MKGGVAHRVPLSDRAIELLGAPRKSGLVFTTSRGKQFAKMILPTLLRKIEATATVHGMRSTFRDWAAETTDYPGEMVEMALTHKQTDKVEAAYRRGDQFQKRIALMAA
jgi:integrase